MYVGIKTTNSHFQPSFDGTTNHKVEVPEMLSLNFGEYLLVLDFGYQVFTQNVELLLRL